MQRLAHKLLTVASAVVCSDMQWLRLCEHAGLENAGNTCYMNSSLQCLYRVPEIRQALKIYDGSVSGMGASLNPAHKLTVRLLPDKLALSEPASQGLASTVAAEHPKFNSACRRSKAIVVEHEPANHMSDICVPQAAAKGLFKQLEDSAAPVLPLHFLMQLRQNFPQFAEQAPTTGAYKQQDAEECWSQLLACLNERLQVCIDVHRHSTSLQHVSSRWSA